VLALQCCDITQPCKANPPNHTHTHTHTHSSNLDDGVAGAAAAARPYFAWHFLFFFFFIPSAEMQLAGALAAPAFVNYTTQSSRERRESYS
jgi:hypothetical protein